MPGGRVVLLVAGREVRVLGADGSPLRRPMLDPSRITSGSSQLGCLRCLDTSVSDVSTHHRVEAMGLEPTNLLTASQALYQLSYAPGCDRPRYQPPPSSFAA